MIVEVTNLRGRVLSATDAELRWLDDVLSFEKKRTFKRPAYGDGRSHMLSRHTRTFPAGFAATVRKYAERDGQTLELLDRRIVPGSAHAEADLAWLRSYQSEAIDRARTRERGVFWHVTGAGKTEVAAALIKLYPGVRWMFVVHRKDLMVQTAERFEKRGISSVGTVGDGVWSPGERVTVAMFQTLASGLTQPRINHLLRATTGLMVDECHVLPAGSFYRVAMATPNAYYRYGFSGTPFARGDDKSLYTWAALGPIIHRVSAERLIAENVIAQPTIHMLPVVQALRGSNWHELYREGIVESRARNAAVVAATRRAEKPCLVFVKAIDHGKRLQSLLEAAGEKVEFVWGDAQLGVRRAAIRRLVHGDTDVLIANVIFQEGIDIPELQSVVIAAGGKSTIAILQDVGRGMRKYTADGQVSKSAFQVFDFADRGTPILARHTRGRLEAYAVEKYPVIEEQPTVY